jgi:UDP-N-acetylmuramyl tripeptide synthase
VGWQGATTPQARACKEEQRRQRARGRPDRARSALTKAVKVIEDRKINVHKALAKIKSGQLPFLGSK